MKELICLISQVDENPPTAIIVKNDFNVTPVFSYVSEGVYNVFMENQFTEDKTIPPSIGVYDDGSGLLHIMGGARIDDSNIIFRVGFYDTYYNNSLRNTPFTIQVYP